MITANKQKEILLYVCRIIKDNAFLDTITFECPKDYEPNFLLRFHHILTMPNSPITTNDVCCCKYNETGLREYDVVRYEIKSLDSDKTSTILERVMAVGIAKEILPIAIMALLVDETIVENKPILHKDTCLIKKKAITWEATFEITTDTDMAMVYFEINEFVFRQSEEGRVQNG